MIILHTQEPQPLPQLEIAAETTCGLIAQLLPEATYKYVGHDLMNSDLIHHIIITDTDKTTCADCVDYHTGETK